MSDAHVSLAPRDSRFFPPAPMRGKVVAEADFVFAGKPYKKGDTFAVEVDENAMLGLWQASLVRFSKCDELR